jgi:hypothetical protein
VQTKRIDQTYFAETKYRVGAGDGTKITSPSQTPAVCCGSNDNDHEREGARTSGVTNLIVAVPAMSPMGALPLL